MKKVEGNILAALFLVVWGLVPAGAAFGQADGSAAPAAVQATGPTASLDAIANTDAASQGTAEGAAPVAIQGTGAPPAVQPTTGAQSPIVASAKSDTPARQDDKELTPEEKLKSLDKDGDRELTLVEYVAGKGGVEKVELEEQFKKWDRDKSATLTLTEYVTGLASLTPWYKAWYVVVGIVALVVLVSLAFGAWMGPLVRMPEASWKFTVIALAVLFALVLMWLRWPPKLGIDLNGGTILAYELDKSDRAALVQGVTSDELMRRLIAQITRRVDPAGLKQITIRSVGVRNDAIEVIVPEVDPTEVAVLKRILQTQGILEFRILAHRDEHSDLVARAQNVPWKVEEPAQDALRSSKDDIISEVVLESAKLEKQRADATAEATKKGKEPPPAETFILFDDRPAAEWKDVPASEVAAAQANNDLVTRTVDGRLQKLVVLGEVKARWVPVGKDESGRVRVGFERAVTRPNLRTGGFDVLVVMDGQNVEGKYLKSARAGRGSKGWEVDFEFEPKGARRFGTLTGDNVGRYLGIILDDELLSAPVLQSRISDQGQITGDFSKKEVDWLVGVLDAGSLPAKLNPTPIRESIADPTLGAETIRKGELAILISLMIVPVAMTLYYRFAGFVAGIAVLVNLLLVVAVMVGVQAAFTLAGLAGLVLTVGMSVDANVLIYERIREELERGAALRMAIRNGFSRATRTIVDSNATNIITAIVLYTVGTEQLKGFAVTLILGILMSMFTAIFCARLVFDMCEKNRWISTLRMTKMIGETNVNFVGAMRYCIPGTIVVIGIGMVGVFMRGRDFLDIDFSGGTKIEMVFKEPHQQEEVQKRLEAYNDNPATPADARLDAVFASGMGKRTAKGNLDFAVETVQANPKVVQTALNEVFSGELKTNRLSFDAARLVSLPGTAAPASTPPAPAMTTGPPETPGGEKTSSDKPAAGAPEEKQPVAPEPGVNQPTGAKPAANDGAQRAPAAARAPALALDPQILFVAQPGPGVQATGSPASAPAVQGTGDSTLPVVQPTGPAGTAAVDDAIGTPAVAPGVNPVGGGTKVELTFEEKVKQTTLREMIQQAGRAADLVKIAKSGDDSPDAPSAKDRPAELNFQFGISNPDVIGDSQLPVHAWTLTTTLDQADTLKLVNKLQQRIANEPVFPMAENVGSQVAGEMRRSAIMAVLISFLAIIGYLWLRFQHVRYGLAAVVALVHDVLITVGILALTRYFMFIPTIEPFKMNLVILAAILTIIGYSLNDTIVIFDRIRELKGKSPHISAALVNLAVNQTLSRTLLTSALTFVVVGVLYFVGGPGVHGFSFTLLIGIIVGTYSSIYVAAPVLLWMEGTGKGTGPADSPRSPRSSDKTASPTSG